jgi:hypothetical protein
LLDGVDETVAHDLLQQAGLQASLDRERAALARERAARAEAERRADRLRQELEQARAAAERVGGAEDEDFVRNTLIKFIEIAETDNGALLQVLAMRFQFTAEELERLHRARAQRAAGTGNSLASGVWALLTPRPASIGSQERPRLTAAPGRPMPSGGSATPTATQPPVSPAVGHPLPATPLPVLDTASDAEERDVERRGTLAAFPRGDDATVGEAGSRVTRDAGSKLRRKLAVTEPRLKGAEHESCAAAAAGQSASLEYLRAVLVRYIAEDDGAESDALFQVIATFLQLDAPTVRKLQASRARKADAQRGIWGAVRAHMQNSA